ncbi:MAG TPA: DUF423 domain-containing protein [Stellaceae bacterium]|nr:DUF423 domain-containing protein [Stellaceae bacterium]
MERIWLAIAGLFGVAAIGADAAARHLLAGDAERLEFAATGARYALLHAAALVGIAALGRAGRRDWAAIWRAAAAWCFVAGLVLFCGSLFLGAAGGPAVVLRLTPAGGVLFMAGWAALLLHALSPRRAG